jgi:2-dehydro-3-deoxyglucarate aldolase/4-hydroxy-2-oxoheptanedioate aldolase
MRNTIIERLRGGQSVRVMHLLGLASPKMLEIAATVGHLHGVWIDQEHNGLSHGELEVLLMACRATGLDAIARVPLTDYATVMRPMEAGCSGVMIAQVRTLDEVQRAVQWAKYPPQGLRGMYGLTFEAGYGAVGMAEHVERANRERWLAVQIETAEAVEIADQIAATDGVDLLFVGPADLSVTLGVPGEFLHPKCVDALQRVSAAAKKSGKSWGALCPTVEHARKCRELGCQFFDLFGDIECVREGFKVLESRFSEFMGEE